MPVCGLGFSSHAGTKSEEARQLLQDSGLAIESAGDIQEAAVKAVASL